MNKEHSRESSSLSLNYVKALRRYLWTIGFWPKQTLEHKENIFEKIYRVICSSIYLSSILVGIYLVKYYNDIDILKKGHVMINLLFFMVVVPKALLPYMKSYHQLSDTFFNKFHLIHFKSKGEYNWRVNAITDKVSNYFTICTIILMMIGMTLFCVPPVYSNYKMGAYTKNSTVEYYELDFPIYLSIPGIEEKDNLHLIYIYIVWASYYCSVAVVGIDLYMSLIMFQVIGHLMILNNDFLQIAGPKTPTFININDVNVSTDMYDETENNEVHDKLIGCVEYHKFIVSFADEISTLFGPVIAFTYCYHLCACCLLLLECSSGDPDALARYGVLTVIIFGQLMQISFVFEAVASYSEKLINTVYFLPWECMDKRNRRAILLLLQKVQTPVRVKAMGLVDVGVLTMASILKTTYTFFTFLKTMN